MKSGYVLLVCIHLFCNVLFCFLLLSYYTILKDDFAITLLYPALLCCLNTFDLFESVFKVLGLQGFLQHS